MMEDGYHVDNLSGGTFPPRISLTRAYSGVFAAANRELT